MATNFTKEDAHDLAYSELYTRCRSIAGALAPCGVQTSIMNSMELAEMLYVAYNRDESVCFCNISFAFILITKLFITSGNAQKKDPMESLHSFPKVLISRIIVQIVQQECG